MAAARLNHPPLAWREETSAWAQSPGWVAGVDEVGRGCLAGPVFAAAAACQAPLPFPADLTDSKKLSPRRRKAIARQLEALPGLHLALGQASVAEIDRLNILRASQLAMARAISALPVPCSAILIDGLPARHLNLPHRAIVGGDRLSPLIAAASIWAKVARDAWMERLDHDCPGYGFGLHKGYGTRGHLLALRRLGPSPHHRSSFAPVRQANLPGLD